jgi:hypothetical protein
MAACLMGQERDVPVVGDIDDRAGRVARDDIPPVVEAIHDATTMSSRSRTGDLLGAIHRLSSRSRRQKHTSSGSAAVCV